MHDKFDELTRSMAQSVTRRGALKKFGFGLAGLALASLGLANKAEATPQCLPSGAPCHKPDDFDEKCCSGYCRRGCSDCRKRYGFCG
jgi:hypothetical protein